MTVVPCAVANLLDVLEGESFECRVQIFFLVERLILFESALESIKKSISSSSDSNFLFFGLSIVQIFSLGSSQISVLSIPGGSKIA